MSRRTKKRSRKLFRAAVVEGFGVLVFIALVLLTIPGLLDANTQLGTNDSEPIQTNVDSKQKVFPIPAFDWRIRFPKRKVQTKSQPLAQANYETSSPDDSANVTTARLYITDQQPHMAQQIPTWSIR